MALTETYCDPSIAGSSGTGTVGDPYGDIQYMLDTMTRDGTNGDRCNIKAGTDEILSAALNLTTYGTPTQAAPLVFQGYTSAAGDGGIGGISGNATYSIINSTALDWMAFIDMHLHNSGSAVIVQLDNNINLINCEIDNTTSHGVQMDAGGCAINCYFHNIGGVGCDTWGQVLGCHFENGTNDFTTALLISQTFGAAAISNTFSLDGSSNGIGISAGWSMTIGNAVYSNAGTGKGISFGGGNQQHNVVLSNAVEGFSGVGGIGIDGSTSTYTLLTGWNALYNNTTNITRPSILKDESANDIILSASPFIDAANGDFRLKPNVKGLGWTTNNWPGLSVRSYMDIGALQAKSQMLVHPGMRGGMNG